MSTLYLIYLRVVIVRPRFADLNPHHVALVNVAWSELTSVSALSRLYSTLTRGDSQRAIIETHALCACALYSRRSLVPRCTVVPLSRCVWCSWHASRDSAHSVFPSAIWVGLLFPRPHFIIVLHLGLISLRPATEPYRILGDSFLRTFYTAYNVEDRTVGLAQATSERIGDECQADAAINAASTPGSADSPDDSAPVAPTPAPAEGETLVAEPTPAPQDAAAGGVNPDGSGTGYSCDDDDSDDDRAGGAWSDDRDGDDDSDDSNEGGALDTANAGEGNSESSDDEGKPSVVAVGAAAVLGSLALVAVAAWLAVMGRRCWSRGPYRRTPFGGDMGHGGAFEMSDKVGMAARHGGEVDGPEDDFLQAKPRKNGSSSRSYGFSGDSGGAKRVVRKGRDEDEEEDEIEVDLGESRGAGRGAVAGGSRSGPLGRLLGGPQRAGFTAFENVEDGEEMHKSGGRLGDV